MTRVRQRTKSDCGLSSLGMLAALLAVQRVDPEMHGLGGLYNRELVDAARCLGITLRSTTRFNLDDEDGIVRLRWNSGESLKAAPEGHFAVAFKGSIYCPIDPVAMPWRLYKEKYDARLCTLLRVMR